MVRLLAPARQLSVLMAVQESDPVIANVPLDNHRTDGLVESHLSQEQRQTCYKLSTCSRKRKRNESDEKVDDASPQSPEQTPVKQQRTSSPNNINWKASCQATPSGVGRGSDHPLQHWIQTGVWREEDFEQTSQASHQHGVQDEDESSAESNSLINRHGMQTRNQSCNQMREQSTIGTSVRQSTRETNNTRYYNDKYEVRLEAKGSHMHPPPYGIAKASESVSRKLLEETQTFPQDSLFRDDLFKQTCEIVQGGNRAMIVRDITPLICPSIQGLRVYGAQHHNDFAETVDETWQSITEYEGPLPQPAYSVGFRHAAFTQEQQERLKPFVGKASSEHPSYFMATPSMFFPFLACEVECAEGALDIADRRNAQSLSMALKALVILFRLAKREKELDRQILGFSISHDHESVRIYGHCPVKITDSAQTQFYRLLIHSFNFASDGTHKWIAYQFTRNVYDHFAPTLHRLICSAIGDLPLPAPTASASDPGVCTSLPDPDSANSQESNEASLEDEQDAEVSDEADAEQEEITPATTFIQMGTPPPD